MSQAAVQAGAIDYPESDGAPMGESGIHVLALLDLIHQLRLHLRDDPNTHVAANLFAYFQQGDPRQVVCPDAFVCRGVAREPPLPIWKTWEHGDRLADVVFEITSRSTRLVDTGSKRGLYEALGVSEYFLFDPEGSYLAPALQGFRLTDGRYRPLAARRGALRSEVLDLDLRLADRRLSLAAPDGAALPHLDEIADWAEAAEGRAVAASEAVRAAEAQTRAAEEERDRLRAEIALLRSGKRTT